LANPLTKTGAAFVRELVELVRELVVSSLPDGDAWATTANEAAFSCPASLELATACILRNSGAFAVSKQL
jgi:hypothetical protein